MDMQTCSECGKKFDFEKGELSRGPILVCSAECGKKSAASRGNAYAIHNEAGDIIDTNATGKEKMSKLISDKREDQYVEALEDLQGKIMNEGDACLTGPQGYKLAAQILSAHIIAEEIERINRKPFPG